MTAESSPPSATNRLHAIALAVLGTERSSSALVARVARAAAAVGGYPLAPEVEPALVPEGLPRNATETRSTV